jgi:hypothetical protein
MPLSRQELISKLSNLVEKESKMLASTPPPLTDTLDIELSIEDNGEAQLYQNLELPPLNNSGSISFPPG